MALVHIPLPQIDEGELNQLIRAKVGEARDIEYKLETYGGSEADHAEWLADVSSFANTAGGDIIIGMDAVAGLPTSLAPLAIDLDKETLRLEQIARSSLQPRLASLEFKRVQLSGGGEVLVVRIGRSFNPPHRIIKSGKGQNRFWARSAAGKYEPNVDELRALFTLAPQLSSLVQGFREERLAKIAGRVMPVTLMTRDCLVLHVVPLSSFATGSLISLAEANRNPHPFAPMGTGGAQNWSVNLEGLLVQSNANRNAPDQRAYVQLYRSGRVEAVSSSISAGERPDGAPPRLTSIKIEALLLPALVRYLKGLHGLGVEPPYVVLISLIGLKGVHMNVGTNNMWPDDDLVMLQDDQLHFGDVVLEAVPPSVQACAQMMRPFLEQLANAAGVAESTSFGPTGEYLHKIR
jgi:hypothetical protein